MATFGGELLGMNIKNLTVIQQAMDVGVSFALLGKFNRSCCRATQYVEADVPPIHVLCSTARARIYLKSRDLKTWMHTLVNNPVKHKGGGQGDRAWIGKTEYWLKRFGPRDNIPAGNDHRANRLSQIHSFLWKAWNSSDCVMNTASMKAYSEGKLDESSGYLHEVTYDERVIRGASHLTAMRIGTFWTAEALAKAGRISDDDYLEWCPCCGDERQHFGLLCKLEYSATNHVGCIVSQPTQAEARVSLAI